MIKQWYLAVKGQVLLDKLNTATQERGVKINKKKTRVLCISAF